MLTFIIVFIILLGLSLLILEFFVFPGMTVAGIGGLIFTAAGLFLVYRHFGNVAGHMALVGTILLALILLIVSFRSGTWNKLMLKSSVSGQVETVEELAIKAGDSGITTTRLNPIGKARVNNEIVEAKCPGQFVDENTEIIVKEVFKTYIIVKPKN
jgi:membrane-bound ClpP family serine protease